MSEKSPEELQKLMNNFYETTHFDEEPSDEEALKLTAEADDAEDDE